MAAPFKRDEKITIERRVAAVDTDYDTELDQWEPVLTRIWANVQDILPSRAESSKGNMTVASQQTRLRILKNAAITPDMRVVLHGRADRVMQIVAGPALLDDREHMEFMLEGYSV
jgi:head-tail adaptor